MERCRRDGERDLERLAERGGGGGERFLLAGDLERLRTGERDAERRRAGGVLDLVRLRGLLVLERRLRFSTTTERERVRLLRRLERERERRDLGGGDLLRRDRERLLERRPPARRPAERDLERRAARLDLELERRLLPAERDRERLPPAPLRLGERVLERRAPPRGRDSDRRPLLGERDSEGERRPLRFGERDAFLFGERELRWRFGDTDDELLRRLGDLDFLDALDAFFLGVGEREAERDLRPARFGDRERDFFLDLGDGERDGERDSLRLLEGVGESFPFEVDLDGVLERSFTAGAASTTAAA